MLRLTNLMKISVHVHNLHSGDYLACAQVGFFCLSWFWPFSKDLTKMQAQGVAHLLVRSGGAGGAEGAWSVKGCNEQLEGVAALLNTCEYHGWSTVSSSGLLSTREIWTYWGESTERP